MNKILQRWCGLLLLFLWGQSTQAQVLINEIQVSTTSTDWEFIELQGTASTNLSNYTIIGIEGDSDNPLGKIDFVLSLAGQTIPADGFWVTANAEAITDYAAQGFTISSDLSLTDPLENGTSTYLLVTGFSGVQGDDLDTNDDGFLNNTPWTTLVDGVGLTDGDAGDFIYEGVASVGPDGSFLPSGTFRSPDAPTGTFGSNLLSFGTPDGTPGISNVPAAPTFDLQITEMWFGQDGTDVTEDWFEVTNTGSASWTTLVDPDLYYDDDSQDAAVADIIQGITSIPPGGTAIVVIGTVADATDFTNVWSQVADFTNIPVGYTDGSGLGNGGDGVTLWAEYTPTAGNFVDFESYPDASANSGQSYDVDLAAFSTVGNANGAIATTVLGGTSGTEPAIGSPAPAISMDLLISEIMYNPNSPDADWEWVEVYNPTNAAIDIAGYVIDDGNGSFHSSANITSGVVQPFSSAVIFNGDNLTAADFTAAWGPGNYIPASNWSAMGLNNGGDQMGLWTSFADYGGNANFSNAIDEVSYGGTGWPSANGVSIYLTTLSGDNNDGANWALSTDGSTTPLFDGFTSSATGTNTGTDVGSPSNGPVIVPNLLLSEIYVEGAEFIEIYNASATETYDLSNVYLTDATFAGGSTYYYNIVTGSNAGGGGFFDFHARFPDGASIAPGEYQTISINGSDAFVAAFSQNPTYELYEDGSSADAITDMREALAGSIATPSNSSDPSSLSNSGEVVVLYFWDGFSDLVTDMDYAVWGDKNEAVDKSGINIDGPDADSNPSTYQNETAIASQVSLSSGSPASGNSFSRSASMTEGMETTTGGNGINGQDETSENFAMTWEQCSPSPNAANCAPNAPPVVATNASQTVAYNTPFSFTPITFTDPNTDPLTYEATMDDRATNNIPSWLTFNPSTGEFSGQATELTQAGFYRIAVTADDGTNQTTATFVLKVELPTLAAPLTRIGGYTSSNGTEIPSYSPNTQQLYVASGGFLEVLDFSDPANPTLLYAIPVTNLDANGGGINSVDVGFGLVAVAIENTNPQANGTVAILREVDITSNNPTVTDLVTVGALPDMLTFTGDEKIIVANEGEPSDDYTVDPDGSISILDVSIVSNITVQTATFTAFNGTEATLLANGVHLTDFTPTTTVAQDFEPEYITVSSDNSTAYVALQENNALAIVDIATATVTSIQGLGFKDHSNTDNMLDPSNSDSGIEIRSWPVLGMYQPDAIESYEWNGMTYIVSGNEGDARDYAAFSEEVRIRDLMLDPTAFPDATDLQRNENLGRLRTTNRRGDTDGDGDFDVLYAYGARSFSIWDANGNLVFDSEDDFGQYTALLTPTTFNGNSGSFDNRSDDKGAEPEGVALGMVSGRMLAFIGLERIGGIMVYDVTNPNSVQFLGYEPSFTGDLAPEGLTFAMIGGQPALVVTNEDSNTISVYSVSVPRSLFATENLNTFLTIATGTPSAEQSYTIDGVDLTTAVTVTASANFEVSLTAGSGFGTTVTVPASTANAGNVSIFVRYNPASGASHTGTITHTSTGVNPVTVNVNGVVSGTITPIATARSLATDTRVTITGTLTVAGEFGRSVYVQDATGGIALFDFNSQISNGAFAIGDSVLLTGDVGAFRTEVQLDFLSDIFNLGPATAPVQPETITFTDISTSASDYLGELVRVATPSFPNPGDLIFGESLLELNDGANGNIFIDGDVTSLVAKAQPSSCTEVIGVLAIFDGVPQIKPRFENDLSCLDDYTPPVVSSSCISASNTLDIVTWNIEWFGHPSNSPAGNDPNAETIQINAVKNILDQIDADIYAFQEIADLNAFATLAAQMPDYSFISSPAVSQGPPATQDQDQQLVFMYRTSMFANVTSKALFTTVHPFYNGGDDSQLGSFPDTGNPDRFFASGRLPFMMTADVTINGVTEQYRFVNLHARANSSSDSQLRYDMRQFDVTALEDTLSTQYGSDQVVLLGDYNDDVDFTVADIASTLTSYDAYTTSPAEYDIVTDELSFAGFRSFTGRENMIDHIAVTNEIENNYIETSAKVYYEVYDNTYNTTASDHLPVGARLEVQAIPACDFSATATSMSEISLSWTDVSNIETSYVLEFSTDNTNWSPVPVSPLAADANSYTHTGLMAGTLYYYRLKTVETTSTNESAFVFAQAATTGGMIPGVSLAVSPMQVNEDGDLITIRFTFTSTVAPASDLTIRFNVNGSATFNDDYYLINNTGVTLTPPMGTIVLPAGQSSVDLVFQVQQDVINENDETIIVTILP